MEKLLRRKILFKAVMISSLVLGGLGLVGTVVFSLFVMYLPLFFSIAFLANALYGTVFYYIGYSNASALLVAIPEILGGARKISDIAPKMGRTAAAAELLLKKCIERGYITGFIISDGELCEKLDGAEADTDTVEVKENTETLEFVEITANTEETENTEAIENTEATEKADNKENADITEGEN